VKRWTRSDLIDEVAEILGHRERESLSHMAVGYFEELSFGESAKYPLVLMNNFVIQGGQGLINYEKARSEFVHAAPRNKEVQVV